MDMTSGSPKWVSGLTRKLCAALALLTALAGCRSTSQEFLEAELREKERQLDEFKQQLDHRDAEVQALEADLERVRRKAAKAAGEPMGSVLLVKKLTLGRATGGYDQEPKIPGDEALQVVVEPRDMDDQTVKAPGCVHIDLFEINPQGLEFLLSTWDLTANEVRSKWDAPLIGGPGYRIVVPWKAWPNSENLRVVVQFTTPEGQRFQADKKFTIRLPQRPQSEELHTPRKFETPPPPSPPAKPKPQSSEQPVLITPPGEQSRAVPPIVAPPLEPPDTSGPQLATPAAYDTDGGTSPSPRARAGLKSPTSNR
jgi:hypothetical protein